MTLPDSNPRKWLIAEMRASLDEGHDGRSILSESESVRLWDWHEKTLPIIAALAIYGEGVDIAALVAKARELNEAKP